MGFPVHTVESLNDKVLTILVCFPSFWCLLANVGWLYNVYTFKKRELVRHWLTFPAGRDGRETILPTSITLPSQDV